MASWILIFSGKGSTKFQYLPRMMEEGKKFVLGIFQVGCMIVAGCNIVVGRLSHKRLYCQH